VPGADDLRRLLERIDGRGYKAYRDLRGSYDLGRLSLHVDHVQGDPFAAPSRLRLRVPQPVARLPEELVSSRVRRMALADLLARRARAAIRSSEISIDAGGQEVLERSAVAIDPDWVDLRLEVGLPAAGRRVLGREAAALLLGELPRIAEAALLENPLARAEAEAFVACVELQEQVRARLDGLGLVAFVGDGAILPRESGASDRPLAAGEAVAFEAPPALRVEIASLTGMGIPKGVTVITGGGYHGKSTLLRALERGVYSHVPGDGREWVVSAPGLVKIRAEDGRRVERVDISAFIGDLPGGRSTRAFSSEQASGSTSQAASLVEALEIGATGLLLDEDTSAANFMVRDARMQALVGREHEPITPFVDRVRELSDLLGVSSVLVMGGSGECLDAADTVIRMREFRAEEVTAEARRIAAAHPSGRRREALPPLPPATQRVPLAESFDASHGRREVRTLARGVDQLLYGREQIDLRGVEQLVDASQTRAVGLAIHLAAERFMDGRATLREVVERVEALLDGAGLDALAPSGRPGEHPGNLARPRGLEIAAAVNRLRTVRMRQRL
jgi:predicted ABC-class ATPase